MPNFTKGPWWIGESGQQFENCTPIESETGTICHVEEWNDSGVDGRDEARANMALIENATELFHALEALADRFERLEKIYFEATKQPKPECAAGEVTNARVILRRAAGL